MAQQRESDKSRSGTPLESARLSWESKALQERDKILPKAASPAIKVILVRNARPSQGRLPVGVEGA